jgi:hypothetical protein
MNKAIELLKAAIKQEYENTINCKKGFMIASISLTGNNDNIEIVISYKTLLKFYCNHITVENIFDENYYGNMIPVKFFFNENVNISHINAIAVFLPGIYFSVEKFYARKINLRCKIEPNICMSDVWSIQQDKMMQLNIENSTLLENIRILDINNGIRFRDGKLRIIANNVSHDINILPNICVVFNNHQIIHIKENVNFGNLEFTNICGNIYDFQSSQYPLCCDNIKIICKPTKSAAKTC